MSRIQKGIEVHERAAVTIEPITAGDDLAQRLRALVPWPRNKTLARIIGRCERTAKKIMTGRRGLDPHEHWRLADWYGEQYERAFGIDAAAERRELDTGMEALQRRIRTLKQE